MKIFLFLFATSMAITSTVSNEAMRFQRTRYRRMRGRQAYLQRAWQAGRQSGRPVLSRAQFQTAMRNVADKLAQYRKFNQMMAIVNLYL